MTSFLRAISCGLIDIQSKPLSENIDTPRSHGKRSISLRHLGNRHHSEADDIYSPTSRSPRRSSATFSYNSYTENNGNARPSHGKRLSGQHIVSRLSRRHRKSKQLSNSMDLHSSAAHNNNNARNTGSSGQIGTTGEDFRIRDEDIAIPSHRPSYACSFASSMTRPHVSITNTSSAFHESFPVPAMPNLADSLAASGIESTDSVAVDPIKGPASDLPVLYTQTPNPPQTTTTTTITTTISTTNHPTVAMATRTVASAGSPNINGSPKTSQDSTINGELSPITVDSDTTAVSSSGPITATASPATNSNTASSAMAGVFASIIRSASTKSYTTSSTSTTASNSTNTTPVPASVNTIGSQSPRFSKDTMIRKPILAQPDHVPNHALVVDTSLDRNFGF